MSYLQLLKFMSFYVDFCCLVGYLLLTLAMARRNYNELNSICYLLILTFISNQIASYCGMYFRNSSPVFHIFAPLQFCFLGWFFYRNLEAGPVRKSIPYLVLLVIIFSVINLVFFQEFKIYPSNTILLKTLLLIILATVLFIEKLDMPVAQNIFKYPVFLAAVAILSFNLFSFAFFLLTNYFDKNRIYKFNSIMNIHHFSNFIYYTTITIASFYSLKISKSLAKN